MDISHLIIFLLAFENAFAKSKWQTCNIGFKGIEPGEEIKFSIEGSFGVVLHDIGRTNITGTLLHGNDELATHSQAQGSKQAYDTPKGFIANGMRIRNNDKSVRAIAFVEQTNVRGTRWTRIDLQLEIRQDNLLKDLASITNSYIPYVGDRLSDVVKMFWPEKVPSVWKEINEKVKHLLDEKVQEAINGIIDVDIAQYKTKLETLTEEIDKKGNSAVHYMDIAQSLIGFEKKFKFSQEHEGYNRTNYLLLPLYSSAIQMKMMFYTFGINQANKIGLYGEHINDVKNYANKTLHDREGAIDYIKNMYKDRVDNAYAMGQVRHIFNRMMTTRSHIAVNGLEYFANWENMISDPSQQKVPYNDVLVYSNLHGRQTAEMAAMAFKEHQTEPLAPNIINDRRNKITKVVVHMWDRIKSKIGGLSVHFENGATHMMGGSSDENHTIDWEGAKLTKLKVFGDDAVEGVVFYFSDERVFSCGERIHRAETVFELPKHHIVGIFLTNDSFATLHQASSIAVSYQSTEGSEGV